MNPPAATMTRATQRSQKWLLRAQAPKPVGRASTKPVTKQSCQAAGLKNQRPSIGQVGTLAPKYSVVSQMAIEAGRSRDGARRCKITIKGAQPISTIYSGRMSK